MGAKQRQPWQRLTKNRIPPFYYYLACVIFFYSILLTNNMNKCKQNYYKLFKEEIPFEIGQKWLGKWGFSGFLFKNAKNTF